MKQLFTIFALLLASATIGKTAMASEYQLVPEKSYIQFAGTHAGNDFNGQFNDFTATIDFDENSDDILQAIVTIQANSAETGNQMYDGTLPTADWFDAKTYPTLSYTIEKAVKIDEGYQAFGILKIKDIEQPFNPIFKISGHDEKTAMAEFDISRLDYNIGKGSDPDAEWVSDTIKIKVNLVADNITQGN